MSEFNCLISNLIVPISQFSISSHKRCNHVNKGEKKLIIAVSDLKERVLRVLMCQ